MNASEILLYTTPQGEVRIEVYFEDETFGLSQKKMAELFDKDTTHYRGTRAVPSAAGPRTYQ